MIGKLISDGGRKLDAEASLNRVGKRFELVFESSGESGGRNRDYIPAFELAIKRLAALDATLTDGRVESRNTRQLKPADKRLHVQDAPYPIRLAKAVDLSRLATRLRSAGAKVGNAAGRGGNTTKRIALEFSLAANRGDGLELARERLFGDSTAGRDEKVLPTLPPLTRAAVEKALRQFDELGRDRFLEAHGRGESSKYFLLDNDKPYDAKAIVGAALAFQAPSNEPVTFGSREATTKRWLEQLGFTVVDRRAIPTPVARSLSKRLDIGNLYSRAELRRILGTNDATIMTGVFRAPGTDSVLLFVTEHKTPDRTQFEDSLRGDTLRWQGQLSGRTDPLIIDHARRGLELLVFYRREKYEYPEAAFRYEGIFRCRDHRGARPTSFILERESPPDLMDRAAKALEAEQAFDPSGMTDEREMVGGIIAKRRGQEKFRAALLTAYGRRCAMTGCDFAEALEAAHIFPYKGHRTDRVTNGLLLRADVHTLFDLGWVAIEPASRRILVHPLLRSTSYRELEGRRVASPRHASEAPSTQALRWHLDQSRIVKLEGKQGSAVGPIDIQSAGKSHAPRSIR